MKKWISIIIMLVLLTPSFSASASDFDDLFGGLMSIFSADTGEMYALGETGTLDDISVTLLNVMESKGNQYSKPSEGNTFIVLEFKIENQSEEELWLSSMLSFTTWVDNCTYVISPDALGIAMLSGKTQADGAVDSGDTFFGVVAYEVPEDWKEIKTQYSPSPYEGGRLTYLVSR